MDYEIKDYYNLYSGKGILDNVSNYLRKPGSESPASYKDRCDWATFPNWCKKAHTIYTGYLFFSKPLIEENDDFDIIDLAKSAAHHALIGGFCWILVMPKPQGPAVYRANQLNVSSKDNSMIMITDGIKSYEINLKENTIKSDKGEIEDFDPTQLILVKWQEEKLSLFTDIGPMNIELFNKRSVRDYHIMKSMIWFLEGPDRKKDPVPYSYVGRTVEDAPLAFVTPPGNELVKTINEDMIEIILNMGSILGISSEFSREIKFQAGISKMIDLIDTNSVIKSIAKYISDACTKAGAVYSTLSGGKAASIQINPILRPTQDNEHHDLLMSSSDFINHVDVTKLYQKQDFRILNPTMTESDLIEWFDKIDKGTGRPRNEFAESGTTF